MKNRRTFVKLDTSKGGAADGSTVDSEGYLWNAQVYDGKIIRYSPDGKKMLFARSTGGGFMSNLYTHVMDVSSLNIGPANWKGVPAISPPAK